MRLIRNLKTQAPSQLSPSREEGRTRLECKHPFRFKLKASKLICINCERKLSPVLVGNAFTSITTELLGTREALRAALTARPFLSPPNQVH